MTRRLWWSEGIRFECQRSGRCCVSHGEYGFVYLTTEDRERLERHLGLSPAAFFDAHCEEHAGYVRLRDAPGATECRFLDATGCSVYEARPTQCRTWPFWPELMSPRAWAENVASFCPGVGRGDVVPAEEIRRQVDEQRRAHEED